MFFLFVFMRISQNFYCISICYSLSFTIIFIA